MGGRMTKLITIDYDEYLELIKYKEAIEEAKDELVADRVGYIQSPSDPFHCKQCITGANNLFDILALRDTVETIEIRRTNY